MRFPELLAKVYEKEMDKVYKAEQDDDALLSADEYASNLDRVRAANEIAVQQVEYVAAYIVAKHRYDSHGDPDSLEEMEEMKAVIHEDYLLLLSQATISEWWIL